MRSIPQLLNGLTRRGRIITGEDPRLRTPCDPVVKFGSSIRRMERKLSNEIHRINRKAKGDDHRAAGLAAPQLGMMVQLFVIDTEYFKLSMVNPQITSTSGTWRPF